MDIPINESYPCLDMDNDDLPWFAGRFRYLSAIGQGAFSQTIRAIDMYDPGRQEVAIKVMNGFYGVIGEEVSSLSLPQFSLHFTSLVGGKKSARAE